MCASSVRVSIPVICGLVLLVAPLSLQAEDPALNARFVSILNKSADMDPDDVAFLGEHADAVRTWSDVTLKNIALVGSTGEVPNPKLIRLLRMLQEADPAAAEKVVNKIIAVTGAAIKEARSQRGETLVKAYLASGDSAMVGAGIAAAVVQYPNVLIRALEMGVLDNPTLALQELGRSKVAAALPVLRSIAKNDPREDVRSIANMAIANISNDVPGETLVKADPVATAKAYVEHVRAYPEWFTEEELEWVLNPVLLDTKDSKAKWDEFVATAKDTPEGRKERVKRNELAMALEKALENPDSAFNTRGNKCYVIVEGKVVATFHKDMLGRWRLAKNP